MLVHPGPGHLVRRDANPSDGCSRDVEEHVATLDGHAVQLPRLFVGKKGKPFRREAVEMDILRADERRPAVRV